jgi:hypothetical protein
MEKGHDLQEVGCGDINWIDLSQGRDRGRSLVNVVMNLTYLLHEEESFLRS